MFDAAADWCSLPLGFPLIILTILLWLLLRPTDVAVHLVYKDSPLIQHVLTHCQRLHRPIDIVPLFSNTHVQTILSAFWPRDKCTFNRQLLPLKDGGTLALDWGQSTNGELEQSAPVFLIIPTMTGDAERFGFLCNRATEHGFRCVVFNKRGHGGSKLSTAKLQSFGDPHDVREVVLHIRNKYPDARIVAAGYSAGSALLVSYLSYFGEDSHITAGIANSPAYMTEKFYNGHLSRFYERLILKSLKDLVRQHADSLSKAIDLDSVFESTCLGEFEDRVYRTLYGYKDMKEYWEYNCPLKRADQIRVPLLCINAYDDPVCLKSNIPFDSFRRWDNFLLVGCERGGHCGFLHGARLEPWADKMALEYLSALLNFRKEA